jgi:hypothetical protein
MKLLSSIQSAFGTAGCKENETVYREGKETNYFFQTKN